MHTVTYFGSEPSHCSNSLLNSSGASSCGAAAQFSPRGMHAPALQQCCNLCYEGEGHSVPDKEWTLTWGQCPAGINTFWADGYSLTMRSALAGRIQGSFSPLQRDNIKLHVAAYTEHRLAYKHSEQTCPATASVPLTLSGACRITCTRARCSARQQAHQSSSTGNPFKEASSWLMLVPLPVITRLQATRGVTSGHEAAQVLLTSPKQGRTQQE